MKPVSDIHVCSDLPLPSPAKLIQRLASTETPADFVVRSRGAILDVIFGDDPRLLIVAGPCSIHDVTAGLNYAGRFATLADQVEDQSLLVMRIYFEKASRMLAWIGRRPGR